MLYDKSDTGKVIRKISQELQEKILTNYYWTHHRKLSQSIEIQLKTFGEALILDCHSFSSKPFKRDLDQTPKRPDFCIGADSYHTPKKIVEISKDF